MKNSMTLLLAAIPALALSSCTKAPAPSGPSAPARSSPTTTLAPEQETAATPVPLPPYCSRAAAPANWEGVEFVEVDGVVNHFDGFGNIEGPVWDGTALYYSNIAGGENPPESVIWRMVPGEAPALFVEGAGSNGLAIDERGRLLAAMHSDGSLSYRSLKEPKSSHPIVNRFESKRFNSPNDLVVSSKGEIYFTDPTWQAKEPYPQDDARVYRVEGGVATPLSTTNAPQMPNGITLSVDETSLWVGGTNGLYHYPLLPTGKLGEGGGLVVSKSLSGRSGIDGLGRDCLGNIYVTVHGEKLVVVLSPEGEELAALSVPSVGGVTNVAFGGPERSTLYVTSLGTPPQIHAAELNIPGYPY